MSIARTGCVNIDVRNQALVFTLNFISNAFCGIDPGKELERVHVIVRSDGASERASDRCGAVRCDAMRCDRSSAIRSVDEGSWPPR